MRQTVISPAPASLGTPVLPANFTPTSGRPVLPAPINPKPAIDPAFNQAIPGGLGAQTAIAISDAQRATHARIVVSLSGTVQTISVPGDFIYLETIENNAGLRVANAIATPLTAKTDTSSLPFVFSVVGEGHRFPLAFNSIQLSNPSGISLRVTLWIGFGEYRPAVVRVGPARAQFGLTLGTINNLAAYAVGDSVLTTNSVAGIFLPGMFAADIIRARLTFNNSTTTSALQNFRLRIFNYAIPATTDHTPFALSQNYVAYELPPIDFSSFVSAGNSDFSYCDLSGIEVPLYPADNTYRTLYFQLIALAAYVPPIAQSVFLDFTVNQS